MGIEKQSAQTLPEKLRQRVVDECKRNAVPDIFTIIFDLLFFASFGIASVLVIKAAVSLERPYIGLAAIPFIATLALLANIHFIRPLRLLRMAVDNSYTYYMGELTGKRQTKHTDSEGDTHYRYHLTIDKTVKCSCSGKQYREAVIGRRYIAVFFGKEKPEFCIELTQKDII